MATYTSNYNLQKPDLTDNANIGVINANMDIIDDAIKSAADNTSVVIEHIDDPMPHRFNSEGAIYKYGFKVENGGLVFMYEPVL